MNLMYTYTICADSENLGVVTKASSVGTEVDGVSVKKSSHAVNEIAIQPVNKANNIFFIVINF